jgi:hypothetical protein
MDQKKREREASVRAAEAGEEYAFGGGYGLLLDGMR